jgi:hypothetical protein
MTTGITWRPEIGDPTLIGWITFFGYMITVGICVRAGRKACQHSVTGPIQLNPAWMWWGCSAVLFGLGINKQLDLQTLLIEVGRQVAQANGWYGHRRMLQSVFTLLLVALTVTMLLGMIWKQRRFFKRNPLLLPGITLVGGYVLLRVVTIDHLDESAGLKLDDQAWLAALELIGLLCIATAGHRATKASDHIIG